MRFDINLASVPYEDARRFYQRAGLATIVVVLLTAVLAFLIVHETRSTRLISAQLDSVQLEIKKLDQQEEQAREILALPENQGTRDQSQFVNGLLLQRAFSWTEVFAELERLMPNGVRVLSMSPKLTDQDQIDLAMSVGGDSREHAIDLLHNLETSKNFRNPQITSEEAPRDRSSGTDPERFDLTVTYLPSSENPPAAKPAAKNAPGPDPSLEAKR